MTDEPAPDRPAPERGAADRGTPDRPGADRPAAGRAAAEAPDVVVRERRGLPVVWVIPIVAALVGGWIWWSALQDVGPSITIAFETAEGLEAGTTKIRFKEVDLGTVTSVMLTDDLSGVTVACQLAPIAEPLLRSSTRFWVVRPRIGTGGVSGLETLVSGAYIAMDPGSSGAPAEAFVGLEEPPVSPTDAPGLKVVLEADGLGSLDVGSPIYFRDIPVGHVERHRLSEDDRVVEIEAYVEEPYRRLVNSSTRFWNASGISVALTAEGFELQTQSIESLLSGGVAFVTPDDAPPGVAVENGARFQLYDSPEAARDVYSDAATYVMDFAGSVRGLSPGAPVEFRGFRLGRVIDIWMEFHDEQMDAHVFVLAELQRGRVRRMGVSADGDPKASLDRLIERGMRARLSTGNLLTGSMYVEMEFHPESEARMTGLHPEYLEIPTLPSATESFFKAIERAPLGDILADVARAVHDVRELVGSDRTKRTMASLEETLAHARNLARALDESAPGALQDLVATAAELRDALGAAQRVLAGLSSEESELNYLLTDALEELSATLRSVRALADYLERHPEALVSGKPPGDG